MTQAQVRFSEWLAQPLLDAELKRELSAMAQNSAAIEDAFGCELQFGTGGLRGVLGAGTNRMNVHVVRRAAQAAADYLNETDLPKCAAIGYDSRLYSERFARETACVFAANGITTFLYPRLEPVPALSFAVRQLSCGLGVCITASHNPAQYNGFKVYGSDGCQLTPAGVARIAELLESRSYFDEIRTGSFDALLAEQKIRWIPDETLDAFVSSVLRLRVGTDSLSQLKLVYTPLNGSGRECVQKLLGAISRLSKSRPSRTAVFRPVHTRIPRFGRRWRSAFPIVKLCAPIFSSAPTPTATAAASPCRTKRAAIACSPAMRLA